MASIMPNMGVDGRFKHASKVIEESASVLKNVFVFFSKSCYKLQNMAKTEGRC
jgi:hypothetical protein